MDDDLLERSLRLMEYIKNFNIHYFLLLRRYERFKKINTVGNNDIEVITYFDMIIVQLRAICIENEKYRNNYTVQILLRKVAEEELAARIDGFLQQEIDEDFGLTIRDCIKILADDFICHYDNFDGDIHKLSLADIITNQLKNPYKRKNLDYIMQELIKCIGEGLSLTKI